MKFEAGFSSSGLRIAMEARQAERVFGAAARITVTQNGIFLSKGDTAKFSRQTQRPDRVWLSLAPTSPALVWVPDFHFAQMVLEHRETNVGVFLLQWPDPAMCRPPRHLGGPLPTMTAEYAREFLFELVAEGNPNVYDNLINNPADIIEALKSLQKRK